MNTDAANFHLRPPHAGDLGWIIHRHGVLYEQEYGWNMEFEVLVARVATDFFTAHDPVRERCWIAEREGANGSEVIGSVFLMAHPQRPGVAKLRLLFVEPSARGIGVGKSLVEACTHFAMTAGYHTITLWTNSVLATARAIYEKAGYRLLDTEAHHSFGKDLVSETWELSLSSSDSTPI